MFLFPKSDQKNYDNLPFKELEGVLTLRNKFICMVEDKNKINSKYLLQIMFVQRNGYTHMVHSIIKMEGHPSSSFPPPKNGAERNATGAIAKGIAGFISIAGFLPSSGAAISPWAEFPVPAFLPGCTGRLPGIRIHSR